MASGTRWPRRSAYDGRQPGDPARAAAALLKLAALERAPLRLALGSDALEIIANADRARLQELERWWELSVSTDYPETG